MQATPQDDQERAIADAILVSHTWNYAASLLYPSVALKELGLYYPTRIGVRPPLPKASGLGPHFSHSYPFPVLLESHPEHYDLVKEFDRMSENYERYTWPYSEPIFEETVKIMRQYLTLTSSVLDTSCGVGTESTMLALLVPEGEVVATDLATQMVRTTFERARCMGIGNMAFFQADVAHLPDRFTEMFDVTFCSLAFHHYPEPAAAVIEFYRVLRPGGYAFVVDPGPEWYKRLSEGLAAWADPGWIGFHTGEEFQLLFQAAGFGSFYWEELLPGIGLVIAMK